MTPELQALIEAVGVWREEARQYEQVVGPLAAAICATYDACMASLTTPPSCLPPAPKGKRWVRVEIGVWMSCQPGDYVVVPKGLPRAILADPTDYFPEGIAVGQGYVWRLEPDPQADSLEKLYADHPELAERIRALIGEGK